MPATAQFALQSAPVRWCLCPPCPRRLGFCFHGFPKGPLRILPRPHHINDNTRQQNHRRISHLLLPVLPIEQDEQKSSDRQQRRQRIQPHPKRPPHLRPREPQHNHSHRLHQKLKNQPNHHQRCNRILQPQKTKCRRHHSQS